MSKSDHDESKILRDYRKQNKRIKLENQALRKRLKQLESLIDIEDDVEMELAIEEPAKESFPCPLCKAETKTFELRNTQYYQCLVCGSKGKSPN